MLNHTLNPIIVASLLLVGTIPTSIMPDKVILASQQINLNERVQGGGWMSDAMTDNILLTLSYLNDEQIDPKNIDWQNIRRDRQIEFSLKPNEVFAFHQDVLDKYQGKVVKTTNSRFNFEQGFKHDGYLMGDGVCHLASLLYWVAKEANLEVEAPVNHDFMPIPGISREYGVSIFFTPGNKEANAMQNLYMVNNTPSEITFKISVEGKTLTASVFK